jgi:hypothetical protein
MRAGKECGRVSSAEGVLKARCLTRKALPDASQKG